MNILSIDPGVNTGWCFWKEKRPFYKGVITEERLETKKSIQVRVGLLVQQLDVEVQSFLLDLVVIERSEFWDTSHRSRTSARTGALQFLSMIVGAYCSYFFNKGIEVKLVAPFQWKGQLPDKLIIERSNEVVDRACGRPQIKLIHSNIHTCCAIGIGAHYLGYPEFNHVKD